MSSSLNVLIFQCTWSLIQLYYYLQPVPIYRTIEKRQNVGCQSSLIAVASIWSRIGGPFSLSTDQMEWRKKPIPLGHETSFCLHFGLIPTLIERRRNRKSTVLPTIWVFFLWFFKRFNLLVTIYFDVWKWLLINMTTWKVSKVENTD